MKKNLNKLAAGIGLAAAIGALLALSGCPAEEEEKAPTAVEVSGLSLEALMTGSAGFTLTQAVKDKSTVKVYAAAEGAALAEGVTGAVSGATLTLSGVTGGTTYYVTVTEPDAAESNRLPLTFPKGVFLPFASTLANLWPGSAVAAATAKSTTSSKDSDAAATPPVYADGAVVVGANADSTAQTILNLGEDPIDYNAPEITLAMKIKQTKVAIRGSNLFFGNTNFNKGNPTSWGGYNTYGFYLDAHRAGTKADGEPYTNSIWAGLRSGANSGDNASAEAKRWDNGSIVDKLVTSSYSGTISSSTADTDLAPCTPSGWVHIAVVIRGNSTSTASVKLYKDGAPVTYSFDDGSVFGASLDFSGGLDADPDTVADTLIGNCRNDANTDYFLTPAQNGTFYIKNFLLVNAALTAEQVAALAAL